MSEESKTQVDEEQDVKHRVFISYSHADAEPATALGTLCRQRGLDVWLDKWDLRAGENWKDALETAVSNSDIFLILLSENWNKTHETPPEWSSICERRWNSPNVHLVPIRLDAVQPPSFLREANYLDALDSQGLARCAVEIERLSNVSGAPTKAATANAAERSDAVARFRSLLDAVTDVTQVGRPSGQGAEKQ